MDHLPILGPEGLPTFRFGGANAWKVREFKDYVVSLEWFGPNGREVDACMVIWNARKNSHDAGAWVIARRQITRFSDEHMRPTEFAFQEAASALPLLGRAPLEFEVRALVDTLLHHIDDLIHMPAAPQRVRRNLAQEAMFEVTHKDKHTGRILREAVI